MKYFILISLIYSFFSISCFASGPLSETESLEPGITDIRNMIDALGDIETIQSVFGGAITPVQQDLPLEGVLCAQYALMKTLRFKTVLGNPVHYTETRIQRIIDIYFDPLENPRLRQDGDLVVYYDDEGDMAHLGVCREDKLVESKWGSEDVILLHPLLFCPPQYGNQFLFFRPKILKNYPPKFLDILEPKKRKVALRKSRELKKTKKKPRIEKKRNLIEELPSKLLSDSLRILKYMEPTSKRAKKRTKNFFSQKSKKHETACPN